jgi:hypothetical protein
MRAIYTKFYPKRDSNAHLLCHNNVLNESHSSD